MDVPGWLKPTSDCQLFIGLSASQATVLLSAKGKSIDRIVIPEQTASACFEPLQQLLVQHKFKRPDVTLVLADDCYQQAELDKPAVPDEEVAAALQWSVKELISIEPDNMQLDYYDMATAGTRKQVMVIAAEREWLKDWGHMLVSKLRGQLQQVLVEELSLLNLFSEDEVPTVLLWQKPGREVRLLLIHKQQLYLSRSLRGSANLENMASEILPSVIDSLSLEVQRALDYFESNLRQPPVKLVKLAVPEACRQLVQQHMSANLAVAVAPLDEETLADFNPTEDVAVLPLLAARMGQMTTAQSELEATEVEPTL
ncbi:hypothetical protein K0504_00170 [Neiella marina]|uniref:MSHA biogenesis protein MshI n=1 Tax=Neiella holothuriorum TaxID=2870530 RepID=A0ABS7EAS2_9GAMM|nr:hypothetical protein [Neiella holothuriorum]MBW8189433.1 hypothetical protein [Neiella holothuriorum]